MVSAPTTRTFFTPPALMNLSAMVSAYTNPVQTACTSNAGQPAISSFACNNEAVLGNIWVGVVVATIMRSISLFVIPAASMALTEAWYARSVVVSFSAAI